MGASSNYHGSYDYSASSSSMTPEMKEKIAAQEKARQELYKKEQEKDKKMKTIVIAGAVAIIIIIIVAIVLAVNMNK